MLFGRVYGQIVRHFDTGFTAVPKMLFLIIFGASVLFSLACAKAYYSSAQVRQTNVQKPQTETREVVERKNSDQQDNSTSHEIVSKWTDGVSHIEVRAKDVELSDDESDVKAIRAGGYLIVEAEQGVNDRYLKITPRPDGSLQRSFFVQGKPQEFDAGAQSWFARVLIDFSRNSDFGADARFRRIFKEHGVAGVLDEIPRISNESIRRAYFQRLLEVGNPNSTMRARAIERAGRDLSASYEKTEFLLWLIDHEQVNDSSRPAFFKVVDALESDYERSRVLTALLKPHSSNDATMQLALKSALRFNSDYELAEFLIQLAKTRPINNVLRTQFLTAVKKLQSSYDQGRVLAALVKDEEQR